MDLEQSEPNERLDYLGVNVFLKNYTSHNGLIYTDTEFLKNINAQIRQFVAPLKFDIDYTEQGMQGNTYVSMGLYVKKRII